MTIVILPEVRLSFPELWKPGQPPAGSQGGPKFGAHFIFTADSDADKRMKAAMEAVAKEKWGANWQAIVASLAKDKKCLRDGNMHLDKQGVIRDGYKDMRYVVARNKLRPKVVDRNVKVELTEDSGRPYGGCWVNGKVEVYAMDKPGFGKSINATLIAVQWVRDGDAFGGTPPSSDGFEDLPELEGESTGGAASDLF